MSLEHTLYNGHVFANQVCIALGRVAYMAVANVVEPGKQTHCYSAWVGDVSEVDLSSSRASQAAICKMGELVLAGAGLDGKLVVTPIKGNELSLGWMGGAGLNGLIVAVSKWTYFVKIVAAPADATLTDDIWYNADGVEIGPVIWGAFATIQEVENDPCAGIHGLQYLSPDHAGLGNW